MLSEILGQPWAIDINPMAILPYTDEDSWGRTCIGDAISRLVFASFRYLESHMVCKVRFRGPYPIVLIELTDFPCPLVMLGTPYISFANSLAGMEMKLGTR